MTPFTTHSGAAAALVLDNVDTDIIIPIQPLLTTPLAKLGEKAFLPLRFLPDGAENSDFVLNRPGFREASILIAGENFGCGSSREPAVHALLGLGLRVVIAAGFGDIFYANCVKNGLLPILLPKEQVRELQSIAEAVGGRSPFEVDLIAQSLKPPGGDEIAFTIDPSDREALLTGRDDIKETLAWVEQIAAFQARDRVLRPWIWTPLEA